MTSCSRSCFKACLSKFRKIVGAVGARSLFLIHGVCSIFITTSSSEFQYSYFLFSPILLLVLEGVVTIHRRRNKEWKWYTPSIGIYQLCVVPSLWYMEYRAYTQNNARLINMTGNNSEPERDCNFSEFADTVISANFTYLPAKVREYCSCGDCTKIMQQTFLLILILGRWLLPTQLTRNQKAQLLLVNIAIASDLLDFYGMMKEAPVQQEVILVTLIMAIWTVGVLQFGLITTATTKRAVRGCECFETEIWTLIVLLLVDDVPLLAIRLVCIIKFRIISHSSVFFTAKNALLFAMDLNRLIGLAASFKKEKRQRQQSIRRREEAKAEAGTMDTEKQSATLLQLQEEYDPPTPMTSYIRR